MLWKHHTNGVVRSSPAVGNRKIVFGSYDNVVYCLGEKPAENPNPPAEPPKPEPPKPEPPKPPEKKTTKLKFWLDRSDYTVDGVTKEMTVKPFVFKGFTMLPARYLVEGIGGTATWDGVQKMVECKTDRHTLRMWLGKGTAELDGVTVAINKDASIQPQLVNGRVFVPFRFLGESLGCVVEWEADSKKINISY